MHNLHTQIHWMGICLLLLSGPALAQNDPPKIALVLSGGGARGGTHIGVLSTLERAGIPIDLVIGASYGALVGGLYAAGYTPDDIERIIRAMDFSEFTNDRPDRKLLNLNHKGPGDRRFLDLHLDQLSLQFPRGLFAGQKIQQILDRLTTYEIYRAGGDFDRLPVPFRSVATDIVTGNDYIFKSGSLSTAVRASIAVPGLFTPVELEHTLLVDGGISNNLPVDVARAEGADIVIAVDVATPLRSQKDQIQNLFDIFDQAISFRIEEKKIQNRKFADVLIMPDLEEFSASSFDRALTLIPLGRTATEAHLETIRQKLIDHGLTSGHTAPRSPRVKANLINLDEFIYAPGQIQIDSIRIQGLNRYPEAAIRNRLRTQIPTSLSTLDRDITILYATGFFDAVTYQLSWESDQTILTFNVQEAIPAEIGLGLHYNLDFQLLGLVEIARPHIFNPGSILFLRGILGKIKHAELDLNLNLLGKFQWATSLHGHTRRRLVFAGESQTGSYRQNRYGFSSALQHLIQNWGRLETGYQTEKVTVENVTGSTPEQVSGTLSGLRAQATVDLLNDADFPTSGLALKTRLDWIFHSSITDIRYRRYLAALNYHISTPSGLTLSLNGNWGLVDGKSPFYEHLHTGGTGSFQFSSARFPGLTREEIRSTHRLIVGAAFRKPLQRFFFGNTQDISFALLYHLGLFNRIPGAFALKDRVHSLGLGFYANTQIPGPIRLELGATDRRDIHIHLSFGYAF